MEPRAATPPRRLEAIKALSQAGGALSTTTGWKTVLLNHLSCQVADYPKEAAYYAALMNWKIRSDDGKQAVLDIGDWGGLVLRGGYQAPPPPPAPPRRRSAAAGARWSGAAAPRAPRLAAFDGFCWGIEPWDAKKVEAELKKRGLTPVADNQGKDFQSFHVKDPDGFDLQISNGNRKNRRQGPANGKTSAPAPFEATDLEDRVARSHFVRGLELQGDRGVLHALLGWKPGTDEGSQNQCEIGDVGDIIIRRGNAAGRGAGRAGTAPRVDRVTSRSASRRSIPIRSRPSSRSAG